VWIRKTARRHGLNTDSSFRFERGCDPNNTLYVLKRAALLIRELAGGKISGKVQDVYPQPVADFEVELSIQKTQSLIGKKIDRETIRQILNSLEINIVSETDDILNLHIPTYRVDVRRDVDVIEDILRIYGYNNVEVSGELKSNLSYQTITDRAHKLQNLISDQLTGCGFSEIMNNSLTKISYYEHSQAYPLNNCVTLMNPLSADLSLMRQTLLFGGLESIAYNRNRRNVDLRFYEFGNCYFIDPEKVAQKADGNVLTGYSENMQLGIWMTGNKVTNNWAHPDEKMSVFELKSSVEAILLRLGIPQKLKVAEWQNEIFSAALQYTLGNGNIIGETGIISKNICKKFDIDSDVYFAQLNWSLVLKEAGKTKVRFSEIPKYPSVRRDLALLLDRKITFAEIEKIAHATEKKLLKQLSLFDVYEGKNLPEGKKSYAVSFILQSEEKTLTDNQIDKVMENLQHAFEQELAASLR
jgi:phenylalanyl-tRNA synthetase beta chain